LCQAERIYPKHQPGKVASSLQSASGAPRRDFFFCVACLGGPCLVTPLRTQSRYRLYTEADVRLAPARDFSPPRSRPHPAAIVHVLKRQGVFSSTAEVPAHPVSVFGACERAAASRSRR